MQRKDKSERKSKQFTIKMTEDDYSLFSEIAQKDETSVGEAIIRRAKNGNDSNPLTVAMIQDVLSLAMDIVEVHEPKRADELRRMEEQIWSTLN